MQCENNEPQSRRTFLAACIVSVVIAASSLAAPSPTAHSLPRYSAELSAGRGARTTQAGAVWYAGDDKQYLRGGLTIRVGSPGRIRPVIVADYSFGIRGDQVSLCGIAPNGSCYQYFPQTNGLAAGVGVRAIPFSRLAVGGSLGVASYGAKARFVDADVAIAVTRRLSALAHWRRLNWSSAAQGDLWFQPLSFDIRVQ